MSLRDNQLSCQKTLALSSRRDNHHPRRDRQNDHPDCRRLPIQIVALHSIVEGGDEGVGVERLVGDQGAGIDGFNERLSARQIVILARAEHRLDGIAEGVDERVNFGSQSTAGSADGLRAVFFWAPALC